MDEKIKLIQSIFSGGLQTEESDSDGSPQLPIVQHGRFFGGVYNQKKYMYSEKMINDLSIEKLERFIKRQIGI